MLPFAARSILLVALPLALLAGCAKSENVQLSCFSDDECPGRCVNGACVDDETRDDVGTFDGTGGGGLDAAGPVDGGGIFGDLCDEDTDCLSGVCIPTRDGTIRFCSDLCDGSCIEPGYLCEAVPDGRNACRPDPALSCGGSGVCAPGAVQRGDGACGQCGEGVYSRTRVCTDTCLWSTWGAWGPCATEANCGPGDIDQEEDPCGDGTNRVRSRACEPDLCTWGEWTAWSECGGLPDAGMDASGGDTGSGDAGSACTPGDIESETETCGPCDTGERTRTRTCLGATRTWGPWSDWGACSVADVEACEPGETESQSESCGTCGTGERTRSRTCLGASCTWGPWSDWGACGGDAGECTPGQRETQDRACGNCGEQSRSRTCNDSCGWSAWSSWSSCSGEGVCSPGARDTGCDRCGERVCSASRSWSACQPRSGNQCLWESGTNWRCCGSSRWQYCLPDTCRWSTDCAACSGCGC